MLLSKIISFLSDKNLVEVIHNFNVENDVEISALSCDSRECGRGTLFFTKGVNFKAEYLDKAVESGACAYVSEKDYGVSIPVIIVGNLRKVMPEAANFFYSYPTERFDLFGITGTKGKSSCAYMIKSIFDTEFGGENTGIISTNEALCGSTKLKKSGTTPEALELYGILNKFAKKPVKAAVMEVSSQGLWYDRVNGIKYKAGVFLNLSPDHISPTEHKSFEEYKEAKKRLFAMCECSVINADDPYAEEMITAAKFGKILTFSLEGKGDCSVFDLVSDKDGTTFSFKGLGVELKNLRLNLPGRFNVCNAAAAIICALIEGVSHESIRKGLEKTVIAGRLEKMEKNGITVLVDYAHNGASFKAIFDYVDEFFPKSKKICLFGCTGNKALDRRKEIPEVAGNRSDLIVMTSDDPAFENPEDIFHEVEIELKKYPAPYVYIEDRGEAVEFAIETAKSGDIVILAGKGHEKTQIVGGKLVPYKGDMQAAEEKLAQKEREEAKKA